MKPQAVLEAIDALVGTVPEVDRPELDAALAARYGAVAEASGSVAVADTTEVLPSGTSDTVVLSAESGEEGERDLSALRGNLLATLDTAYQTYISQIATANTARATVKGRKKPAKLETTSPDTIRAEVEALLANEAILAELQDEIDYFTKNPEANSPAPGFNIIIPPEGMTADDNGNFVRRILQPQVDAVTGRKNTPYVREAKYNDPRTPETTGKGYRIAFAPRHYNVPKGTAQTNTNWMNGNNARTTATELQTADDTAALAQINNLTIQRQISAGAGYNSTRFYLTDFRRFDQAPFDDYVSRVFVYDNGRLRLGRSYVHNDNPARALVVPKA